MIRIRLIICILSLLVFTSFGSAQDSTKTFEPFIGWSVWGGVQFYDMSYVNTELDYHNRQGAHFDKIKRGPTFGLSFCFVPRDERTLIYFGFDRLNGSSEYSDFTGSMEFDVSANAVEIGTFMFLPDQNGKRFYVGAAGGLCISSGEIIQTTSNEGFGSGNLEARCVMGRIFAGLESKLSNYSAINLQMGYRFAKADDVKVNGTTIENFSLDWSGVSLRAALSIYLK